MTDAAERYAELASRFVEVVRAVPEDAWSNPSPCEGWTARDVVDHVVGTHAMFLGLIDIEAVEHPPVEEDPLAATLAVTTQVAEAMASPAIATKTYEGIFGEKSFEWGIDTFQSFDLAIHGWDLAAAAGLDYELDPDEIERLRVQVEGMGDTIRSPGVAGPALDPPEGADPQTRLLAYLGRKAW